jgi:glycosyltransferase involved in cell wall biosynthesis
VITDSALHYENPFFSIIIPTKNRHFLVGYAIKSVLLQTFPNYEIIIVDNDDSMQTQKVVSEYEDVRIRYFRTGNLSMSDNWEYGLNQVRGKYILLLEDKMALKSDALIKIHKIVVQYPDYPVCWRYDVYDDVNNTFHSTKDCDGTVSLVKTDQLVKSFLECDFDFFNRHSPRGLNSCTPKKVIDMVRLGPMKHFFLPLAPDFNSAFQLCVYTEMIVSLNEALVIIGGVMYSNGVDSYKRGPISQQFLNDNNVKSDDELYECVPLKVYSVRNGVINEFFKLSLSLNGKLSKYPLNIEKYFLFVYDELKMVQTMYRDTSAEIKKWRETVENLDPLMKQAILSKMKDYDNKYSSNPAPRSYFKPPVFKPKMLIKKVLSHLPFIKQKNILDYVNPPGRS